MSNMSLKKAWYGLIGREIAPIKPTKDPRANHEFSDEDREHSAEMRRLRQQTARMRERMDLLEQKRELEELREEMGYGANPSGEEDTQTKILEYLTPILTPVLANLAGGSSKASPPTMNTNPPVSSTLSDEDIRAFIAKQDRKHIKQAKILPKPLVIRQVKSMLPVSDEEAERAYTILQEEF